MREIILDTETSGIEIEEGHRIVEFGAVEMIDKRVTGNTLHLYMNPERKQDPRAIRVHGLTDAFLRKKPRFDQVSGYILDFIGKDPIVAHNAAFDIGHLQAEMRRYDLPPLTNPIIDTLAMSRAAKPGGKHNLDVMCSHFKVDKSKRIKHGALIDAQILAEVYVHLCGGRQLGFDLGGGEAEVIETGPIRQWARRSFSGPSEDELAAHAAFIATLPNAVWHGWTSGDNDLADQEVSFLSA